MTEENNSEDNSTEIIELLELPILNTEKSMLTFETEEDFIALYNYLEKISKDENYSFEELKTRLPHSSLMDKYLLEEEAWLNNEVLDFANDPDDNYVPDDIYRMLLNEEGEIVIGNSIYKFTDNFTVYKINNKNWESLEEINKVPNAYDDYSFLKDVELLNCDCDDGKNTYTCKQNYSKSGTDNYQTDRLVKWKASVINLPAITRVKAEVWSYKRKSPKKD